MEFWVKGKDQFLDQTSTNHQRGLKINQVEAETPKPPVGEVLGTAVDKNVPGRMFAPRFIDNTVKYFKAIRRHR